LCPVGAKSIGAETLLCEITRVASAFRKAVAFVHGRKYEVKAKNIPSAVHDLCPVPSRRSRWMKWVTFQISAPVPWSR